MAVRHDPRPGQPIAGLQVARPSAARAAPASELLVADGLIRGADSYRFRRNFDEMVRGTERSSGATPSLGGPGGQRREMARGVRHFLHEDVGIGYWDYFRLSPQMHVLVTDAAYHKDEWVPVEGERSFRIRLVLAGQMLDADKAVVARGPQGRLHVGVDPFREGYFIAGGQPTKMVVILCEGALLKDVLGLDRDETPPPFDRLFDPAGTPVAQSFALTPKLARATQQIIGSRHELPRQLRSASIAAVSMEALCALLGDLTDRDNLVGGRLGARDLNRIYEARDFLSETFDKPPPIEKLARLVGVNQTKLKAGFKEVFGLTIYDYVLSQRMQRAAELLRSNRHTVAEIAYMVGYEYPANFTCAFRRHFGAAPRQWQKD